MWSRLISTWRNLTERTRVERELDDELRAYVELLTAEKIRIGLPPERAKREALMEAGGMERVKEEVRDASAGRLLNELGQDVRHSLRSLGRNAASSALAVATLMLGIGAATVIFSVFYTVLLRPLPFANLERLVEIHESRLDRNIDHSSVSVANFWDLRAQRRTFDEIAAYTGGDANMTGNGAPEHVTLGVISAGWWRVLGVQPILGRDFLYEEDRPGAPNVALLRHRFWKQRFQGDPAIVGQTIRLNDKAYLVVGVLPPGEPWLNSNDVFVPMVYSAQADRGSWELEVVGRMSRGVTIESARADLQNIAASLARQYPQDDKGMGVAIGPATEWVASKELRRALWVLLGAVGLLLLIACVNVANLLLARGTQRSREIAIRRALGAGRSRIIRLLLTESVMLSTAGAALGVALAEAAAIALRATQIDAIPRLSELSLNGWVLAGTLIVAVLTGLLSGLAPALQAPKDDVNPALHEGGRTQTGGRGQSRLRWLLVATEVALSLALLVGSGLLIRSFDRLANVDRGFQSQNRVLFTVSLPNQTKPERVWQVVEQFRERAQALPEIISVAGSSSRLITGASTGMGIIPVGREGAFGKNIPWAQWRMITPGYLETIGVTLKKGRLFDAHDQIAKPWRVLISQRLATTLFPDSDPIGHQVALWAGQNIRPAEVIGVVGDMRERGLASDPILAVYIPQNGAGQTSVEFVAHTRGDAVQAIPHLRAALAEVDPTLPLSDVQSIDHLVNSSLAPNRFRTVVLSVFGGLALLLAVTGVYGVLAYSVSRRTPEFGLRLALGANPRSLLLMTVSQGMRPVVAGIVLGAGLASLLSSYLATLLFGIQELDWPTYAAVAVLVSITAFLACCLPALRATKVDPAVALRAE